jgi:hypothetical protein
MLPSSIWRVGFYSRRGMLFLLSFEIGPVLFQQVWRPFVLDHEGLEHLETFHLEVVEVCLKGVESSDAGD